jgi:hypothetical protein
LKSCFSLRQLALGIVFLGLPTVVAAQAIGSDPVEGWFVDRTDGESCYIEKSSFPDGTAFRIEYWAEEDHAAVRFNNDGWAQLKSLRKDELSSKVPITTSVGSTKPATIRNMLISSRDNEPGVFKWVKEQELAEYMSGIATASALDLTVDGSVLGHWPLTSSGKKALGTFAKCVARKARP